MSAKTYVTHDGEWNDDLDAYETAYAAVSVGAPWNGWATPVLSQDVAGRLVARLQQMLACADDLQLSWDGNGILVSSSDPDVEDEWIMPNEDGNFDFGSLGWTFSVVEDANVVRRIG